MPMSEFLEARAVPMRELALRLRVDNRHLTGAALFAAVFAEHLARALLIALRHGLPFGGLNERLHRSAASPYDERTALEVAQESRSASFGAEEIRPKHDRHHREHGENRENRKD